MPRFLRVTVFKEGVPPGYQATQEDVISFEDLRSWITRGQIFFKLFRWRTAELRCYRLETLKGPFIHALALRLLCWRSAAFVDARGARRKISWLDIFKLALQALKDYWAASELLKRTHEEVAQLKSPPALSPKLDLSQRPLYLRSDFSFGIKSGGSLTHIAGVVNHLDRLKSTPLDKPRFFSSDTIGTIREDIPQHIIWPENRFLDFYELREFNYNRHAINHIKRRLGKLSPAFIYQRYAFNSYAGLALARHYHIPFVCEYNGSEVWISRHWIGKAFKYEPLSIQIEQVNLTSADLVVTVSNPLKDQLMEMGVAEESILVNPNGVDPERYHPEIDGGWVREQWHLEGYQVIGFIGTFGRWHGAEVLADAFGVLIKQRPELRDRVRLLMIGDGVTMPEVREIIARHQIKDVAVLTGLQPQSKGGEFLAACDLLISPHIANPDKTPFFGSPTKLFEYMAMGKGIIASDLDQIGDILDDDQTARLVPPGDVNALAKALGEMIDNQALARRLGRAAREMVVKKYSWKVHTERIIDALKQRVSVV
ncbi:glycosyltransferase family 4 protein [Magnetococcales bacterium HHB-1]